ncbi:Very-long-chain 3-oxoacyl-CoA reductase [Eumeta japonica]|uniref:Very-long-chain 3-oxoacyl-CoA reductase n=1 Tax=Eumeta variegata TaxID=151549 RepID=A0A4C1UXT4_EUMVA|nr:Very-long-chain 3-oxoacyl-CoA reductase [Eumeta japonica]
MMDTLVKANMVSMIRMSGLVMPGMVKRGRGVVINIGSASSDLPSPLLSVYAASKAFVDKFSESLKMEYEKSGIIVQVVKPGFVCSNMSQIRRSTFLAPTAKKFVQSALSTVGVSSNTTGFFPHDLLVMSVNMIKEIAQPFAVWLVLRTMEKSRARFLKKYKSQ